MMLLEGRYVPCVWASHLQADVEAEPYMQPRELRLPKYPPAKEVLLSRGERVMPPAIHLGTAVPLVQGRPEGSAGEAV